VRSYEDLRASFERADKRYWKPDRCIRRALMPVSFRSRASL